VGAFGDGINGLEERDIIPRINDFAESGRPIFGVCLGMQLIMSRSEEFGTNAGLDLLPGRVRLLEPRENGSFKVPHISCDSLESNSTRNSAA